MSPSRRCALAVVALWAGFAATPALAQTAAARPDGRIDLKAQQAPVGRVLRELAAVVPMSKLLIDPAAEATMVAVPEASGLSRADALDAVLSASKLPYLVWGGQSGPWRVVLGNESSAVEVSVVPPSSAADARADNGSPATDHDLAVEAFVAREAAVAEAAASKAEPEAVVVDDAVGVPGGYTLTGENVTYHDPTFVPYKNRPEVRARRLKIDVNAIP
jgi:hypothetical protein